MRRDGGSPRRGASGRRFTSEEINSRLNVMVWQPGAIDDLLGEAS